MLSHLKSSNFGEVRPSFLELKYAAQGESWCSFSESGHSLSLPQRKVLTSLKNYKWIKNQNKCCSGNFWSHLSALPIYLMGLSWKTQLPSSWSSKFTHAGVVSGSILVGMRREKSEKVARGPPVVDHHQPTAALCKQLIYAHILCIAGLDYSRTSPGWIIPIYNRAGRFPQITRQDYQAGLFPIEYVTSYFVLETTYLIFVTGTTGGTCGEKVCDEEKF